MNEWVGVWLKPMNWRVGGVFVRDGKARVFAGVAATALLWLYLYAGQGAGVLPIATDGGLLLRICVPIGLISAFVVLLLNPRLLCGGWIRKAVSAGLVIVLLATQFCVFMIDSSSLPKAFYYGAFLLRGVVVAFVYAQMAPLLFKMSSIHAAISLTGAMAAAGVASFAFGYMPPDIVDAVLCGCLVAALLLFLLVPIEDEPRFDTRAMFRDFEETRPLFCELFFLSVIYGFFVMFATIVASRGFMAPVLMIWSYFVPSAVLLLMVIALRKRVDFLTVRWIVIPLVTVVLVPMLVLDVSGWIVCLAVILALFQVIESSSALGLAEVAREHDLPPVASVALLRVFGTAGLLLGRVVSMGVFSNADDIAAIAAPIIAALTVMLILWRSLVSNGINEVPFKVSPAQEASRLSDDAGREESFERRCSTLAEGYGLSSREAEVFALLAKGRTAEHIGKQLYVSENTVRSHIQRIYRKMGVHSRQELLDAVDGSD